MDGFHITVKIVEEQISTVTVPNFCRTVEDVIQHCLFSEEGIGHFEIPPKDCCLFGLQTESLHWLRPALLLEDFPSLLKKPDTVFAKTDLTTLTLRLRYLFPPSKVNNKIKWPTRPGGDILYNEGLWRLVFHQIRNDYLSGRLELDESVNQFSQALGLAVIDTVRIKKEGGPSVNYENLLPGILRAKRNNGLVNSFITSIRTKKLFKKSVKAHELNNLNGLTGNQMRDQYLYNLIPNIRKRAWGEVFDVTLGKGDKCRVWIHPENGIQLQREGETNWKHRTPFRNVLFTRRLQNQLIINFMDRNDWELSFSNKELASDCHMFIEGMVNITVDPHSYQNKDVTWPMLLEERTLKSFGPLTMAKAKCTLKPGFSLIRRSCDNASSQDWFITRQSIDGEYQNYSIKKTDDGKFTFVGGGDSPPKFNSMIEVISQGKDKVVLPFDISRRLTPLVSNPTRTKIIPASHSSMKNSPQNNIDLPSHALYPESKVTSKSVLGAGRFTEVYQGRMQIEQGTQKERLVVTKGVRTTEQLGRSFHSMDITKMKSIKDAFHESLNMIHNANHPHIVRLLGILSSGSIILERAPGGSIDFYLRRKQEELSQNEDRSSSGPDIEYDSSGTSTLGYPDFTGNSKLNSSSGPLNTGQTIATEITVLNTSSSLNDSSNAEPAEPEKRNWVAWKLEVLWQVATALQYLRNENIFHGKVKASNVLLFTDGPIKTPQPQVKLSDPGVVFSINQGEREMDLPPPWIPLEYISRQVEKFPTSLDNWSFATFVSEIGQWCYKPSLFKMNLPLNRMDKEKYCTQKVAELPTWISDLNPMLHELLKDCWNPEPTLRPSFGDLLRELAEARISARESDATLTIELPSSVNAMDDYMSVSTYQDMRLTSVKQLGQGHFGVVELCSYDQDNVITRRSTSELVAVKSLRDNMRTVTNANDFRNEFDIWREFDHKNIVKLLGLSLPSGRLVMEYIERGSLFYWLGSNNKKGVPFLDIYKQLVLFGIQICEGMEYIHSKGKIHRDLAARNVMVGNDPESSILVAKISDFGLSRQVDDTKDYYRGNPEEFPVQWYAPECIKDQSFHYTSDVWSYGVTLWEIFSYGQRPEYKNPENNKTPLTLIELFQALEAGRRLPRPDSCPPAMFNIINQCWSFKHDERPSFTELFTILQNYDEIM